MACARKWTKGLAAALALLLAAGCAGFPGPGGSEPELDGEFIILWDQGSGLAAEDRLLPVLEARFPDASFESIRMYRKYHYERVAPYPILNVFYDLPRDEAYGDLIMFEDTLAPYLAAAGYLEPLDEYLAGDMFWTESFAPETWDRIKAIGGGTVYGVPYGKNVYALYYNKAFFDELGLPHPHDGITWEEVFALSRQINENPARGDRLSIGMMDFNLPASQLHFRFLKSDDGGAGANHPAWPRLLDFIREWNERTHGSEYRHNAYVRFAYNRTFMVAGRFLGAEAGRGASAIGGFVTAQADWDMAAYPVFAEAPDTGPGPAYYYLGIPRTSTRKEEAFRLITYLLSDEVQLENSRNGLASARREAELNARYGENESKLQGKRVEAFFHHPAEGTYDAVYDFNLQDMTRYPILYFYQYDSEALFSEDYFAQVRTAYDYLLEELAITNGELP